MVSMLGPGQPVVDAESDDRPVLTDWALRDVGAWTKLVVSVGLGVALGAVNLAAVGAPGMLRIPAFLAALILCAQGPVDIGEYQREKEATILAERESVKEWEERQEARQRLSTANQPGVVQPLRDRLAAQAAVEVPESQTEAETRSLHQQAKRQDAEAKVRAGAVADSRGGLIVVAVLAIWLGLATLNYPASPPLLLWLSLVASFLLFVSVWGGLQKRPAGS
ncbi:MAG TPA: hypothetical protein VEV65_14920 [Kineosporiaceae bacterium]|jgi:hypothetical protein|nr:hypothetical protein [Kineosporiaceae bacterium]